LTGAAAILAGAVLLSWQGGPERVDWGGLAIAGACLAWGLDNNLTRRLSAADPVQIALIKGLAAGAVNLVLALLAGARLPSAGAIGGAAVVGFVGYGVSLVLFVLGLRHLGAARRLQVDAHFLDVAHAFLREQPLRRLAERAGGGEVHQDARHGAATSPPAARPASTRRARP